MIEKGATLYWILRNRNCIF